MNNLQCYLPMILLCIGCQSHKSQEWCSIYEDGKEEGIFTYDEHPLEYYQTHLLKISAETRWSNEHDGAHIIKSKIWNRGKYSGRVIYEVWNNIASDGYYNSTKLILIETNDGMYRPLYHLQDLETYCYPLNPIISNNGITINACPRHGPSSHVGFIRFSINIDKGAENPIRQ